jgi:tetratricopeptide (TPR) repeat protein
MNSQKIIKTDDKVFSEKEKMFLISQAIMMHKNGKISDSIDIYKKIISQDELNFDALQLLATAYVQTNRLVDSMAYFDMALSINPNNPELFNNLGNALRRMGKIEDSLKKYESALLLKPNYPDALHNKGLTLKILKQYDESIHVLKLALQINPEFIEAHNTLGNVYEEMSDFSQALCSYDIALKFNPRYVDAMCNKGNVLQGLGRFTEAVICYEEALRIQPKHEKLLNNLGNALQKIKKMAEAIESYDKALVINPKYLEVYCNRGIALAELNDFESALISFNRALDIDGQYVNAHRNKAKVLKKSGRLEESLQSYEVVLKLTNENSNDLKNVGDLLYELGRVQEALKLYDQAISIAPEDLRLSWNKALALIMLGRYEEGWLLYEIRLQHPDMQIHFPKFSKPLWRGEFEMKNKTLLVYSEQGLGDTIQFARYLESLVKMGIKVVFLVPRVLLNLLRSLGLPVVLVERESNSLPDFDAHCPLLSLPYVFKTTLQTIPNKNRYLRADSTKISFWQKKLGPTDKRRIGVVWAGSPGHNNDMNRSIGLNQFKELFTSHHEWHSLQVEYREGDLSTLEMYQNVYSYHDQLNDFSDTAALIEMMDLIITVDTSVAHLAGAMGKNVWILLPYAPDYRWTLKQTDCPWYSSAKLFRQKQAGDWGGVINDISKKLMEKLVY